MANPRRVQPGEPGRAVIYGLAGSDTAALRAWCGGQGLQVVAEFEDPQADALDRRSGFIQALRACELEHAGVLVTSTVSTLARGPAEHGLAERVVQRAGARWVQVDTSCTWPVDLVESVVRALRSHESLMFTPKVGLGIVSPKRGRAGPPPWGFERDAAGNLRHLPGAEAAIAAAVRMRAEGAGLGAIAEHLTGLGVVPGRIYKSTVKAIISRAAGGKAP